MSNAAIEFRAAIREGSPERSFSASAFARAAHGLGALGAGCAGDDDATTATGETDTTGQPKRGGTFRLPPVVSQGFHHRHIVAKPTLSACRDLRVAGRFDEE